MSSLDRTQFIHPLDRTIMDKILGFAPIKALIGSLFENGLDEISSYLYDVSGVRLGEEHPACRFLREGCELFGVAPVLPVYTVRAYAPEVTCGGYSQPVVMVPHSLLLREDMDILRGRMLAAAASIAAGHHKIAFLIYLIDNFSGVTNIPLMDKAVRTTLNEWKRSRSYTLDRAFYLATGDYSLALRNVLVGEIPDDVLGNFTFGGETDTYQPQVDEYTKLESAADVVSGVMAFLQAEVWLPPRYRELQRFHAQMGGGV